ncbi:hypothetical protein CFC21_111683 [Triticum aestivum]|uniref:DUF4220 domain-containing protein n=2 Tax=Triticum aestivum TaxID=4565 RepID=A0A9R1NFA0_WHEAT|nr:hypothetical protein CFC21_111681 [Triticum aestivum]KAF7111701.1 hypothetical protein CFC21_111682 [Triticum aestivum]KAF7111702.1 hypothetical protein CFC21_111683 [Triticum aestivum]
MPSWMELWNEWEIQVVVVASFSLQVILFFFAGIRRYSLSFVLKSLLWLVYLLADLAATYALGHMSSTLSKKSSGEHQLVAFWAPFLLLHLGGQDTITAYALEDNELWLRHLLNMFLQVAGAGYVLYKYITAGRGAFVPAAMLILAAGVIKYGERIWALKLASKGGSHYRRSPCTTSRSTMIYKKIRKYFPEKPKEDADLDIFVRWTSATYWFTKSKRFRNYASIVRTAHELRYALVKPLIIDRNEASIEWDRPGIRLLTSQAFARRKTRIGEVYKAIEVELGLMYDMLYTKAEVIHTSYGYFTRAISLVSCFAALVVFTRIKRDDYNTPDVVITFALLGGACALETASVLKVIGSTWTYAVLKGAWGGSLLADVVLFARYHLVVVKDGRWSNSVGQFDFIYFCYQSNKNDLKGRIARLIRLRDMWDKARSTKRAKLSPAVKEFIWDLLRGEKSHMVQIEDVAIQSGYWARRFRGFDHTEHLDWSMSFEFQKSVLIWHIATRIFLNDPAVKSKLVNKDKDMAEAVHTLSNYMMYLLIEHPGMLPVNAAARDLFRQTCTSYIQGSTSAVKLESWITRLYEEGTHQGISELCRDLTQASWDASPGEAMLVKSWVLAHIMLDMELGLTHKIVIIGAAWTEMLCYAATNATEQFHGRQLSNGGEFLTHILLLNKYCAPIDEKPKAPKAVDEPSSFWL